ncbi:MAG: hypothetical protein Q9190_001545 [Brigantiaea leucoxantha]
MSNTDEHRAAVSTSSHRRTLSGSLLSGFSFLQTTQKNEVSKSTPQKPVSPAPRSPRSGAMASAMKQTKTRKRKGSLRKTALLGTGRLRTDQSTGSSTKDEQDTGSGSSSEPTSPEDMPTPQPLPKTQPPVPWVSHPVHGILHKALIEHTPAGKLQKSPTLSSTTDEDDLVKPASTLVAGKVLPNQPFSSGSSTSDSYFPLQPGILLPHLRHSPKSPLSAVATETLPAAEEWSYSETRWWGWVILAMTWIVFVVGMGSCFEIWSWAWDVGETPYAPPELEDDPTLPIVGYYPALIILTSVMAWVWVTVAWVGMKYFKHARMGGDDE